jgi:isopentenyl diphosphate isomerase/L-lactate dehydrogenase-like FMN-dependent dehydrogenase
VEEFPTIDSVIAAAHRTVEADLWDYLSGGAESETTLHRNRAAFDGIALCPRLLRGVRERDSSTTFLGNALAIPIMLAPVGSVARYHPDGALACAQAAQRAGTVAFVSSSAAPALEQITANSDVPVFFQQYLRGDGAWLEEQVRRAEDNRCAGFCITADVAAPGHRERNLMNHFGGARGAGSTKDNHDLFERHAQFTWADFARLRDLTALPLVLKGVTSGADALLAVEHGADVVYVSNHGGRQIDHLPSTIEVLPEVVAAVDGRAEVIVDGGFVRGSDVVKGLALGARAVLVGKLMVWGLAAGGPDGLDQVLGLLAAEVADLLAHLGVAGVRELGPEHVAAAAPVAQTEWIGFAQANPGRAAALSTH